uniref:hypothetical protein n=1 Tax=Flavobacterium sp. TaxID=239 RepID=UPI0037C135C3
MKTDKSNFVKYSNIGLVRGYNRGIIYDFFRNDYHFVPNSMIDFIELYNGKVLNNEIKSHFKDYTDFLTDKELIFFCEATEVECFIDMSTEWDYFSIISNAIIEVDDELNAHFEKTISYLCKLGCEDLLIFSKTPLSSVRIHNLFKSMKDKLINSIN